MHVASAFGATFLSAAGAAAGTLPQVGPGGLKDEQRRTGTRALGLPAGLPQRTYNVVYSHP